jgi:ribose/xylose/arabinose/galactoside ABC-type transport system permease subunit
LKEPNATPQSRPDFSRSVLGRILMTPAGVRRETVLLAMIIALIAVIPFFNEYFLRFSNLRIILLANSHVALMALGMGMLLVVGEVDLSIGSVMGLAGIITALCMKQFHLAIPISIFAGLAASALVGAINGIFIVKVGINFLIMTLAAMGIVRGLVIVLSEAGVAYLPPAFNFLGQAQLAGFALPVWITAFLAIVLGILLAKNRFFRQINFIGGNPNAAKLIGIAADRIRILLYVQSAVLAGIAGVLGAARFGSAMPSAGTGVEMMVIAACVLGGCSLAGGQGTILGVLVGVLFLGLLSNVLVMLNVSTFWHEPINGVVLIVAITLDIGIRKWRDGRRSRALLARTSGGSPIRR